MKYLRPSFMRNRSDQQAIDDTVLMVYRKISSRYENFSLLTSYNRIQFMAAKNIRIIRRRMKHICKRTTYRLARDLDSYLRGFRPPLYQLSCQVNWDW